MDAGSSAPINYRFLAEGLAFYTACGFDYMEVPWLVSEKTIRATLPAGATPFSVSKKDFLVGSAEQSFIELMLQKKKLGKHCAITPCFRDDAVDDWHRKYFMKLELYHAVREKNDGLLDGMIETALAFYRRHLNAVTQETPEGMDIVCAVTGVELGSYGFRSLAEGSWIYGTGVAEPRLSSVLRALAKEGRRRA